MAWINSKVNVILTPNLFILDLPDKYIINSTTTKKKFKNHWYYQTINDPESQRIYNDEINSNHIDHFTAYHEWVKESQWLGTLYFRKNLYSVPYIRKIIISR